MSKMLPKKSLNCNVIFPMVYGSAGLKKPVVSKNIIYYLKDQKDSIIKTADNIGILDVGIDKLLPIEDSPSASAVSDLKPVVNDTETSVILKTLAFPLNPSDKNQIDGVYGTYSKKISTDDSPKPFSVAGNEGLYQIHSFVDSKGSAISVPEDFNLRIGDFVVPRINNSGTWCTFKTIKLDQLVSKDKKTITDYLKISAVDTNYNGTARGFGILEAATAAVNGCTALWFKTEFEKLARKDFNKTNTKDYYCLANAGNSQVAKLFTQIVKNDHSKENGDFNLKTVSIVRERETPEETEAFISNLKEKTHTDFVITETQNQDREFKKEFQKLVDFENSNVIMGINAVGGTSARGLESKLSNGGTVFTYGGMSLKGITASTTAFIFRNIKYLGLWITQKFKEDPKLKAKLLLKLRGLYNEGKLKLDPEDYKVIVWNVKTDSDEKILKKIKAGLELKGKKPIVFVKHERAL